MTPRPPVLPGVLTPRAPVTPGVPRAPVTPGVPRAAVVPVVHLVGAGPGDPMLLTRRAARLLAAADVVVLDRRSLDAIAALAPPAAERVLVGRADGRPAWDTEAVADLLADRAKGGGLAHSTTGHGTGGLGRAGNHQAGEATQPPATTDTPPATGPGPVVVRVKSGDAFVCSRGGEEMAALLARGVHVEVTPGVSAATAAPLAARMPRGEAVTIVAGNHDPEHPLTDVGALADPTGSLVVLVGRARQGAIADALVAAGLDPSTPAAVVHAATRPGTRVVRTTVGALGAHRLPPPATVVIGPTKANRAHP